MALLEKMGCSVANALAVSSNGALSAVDDTIFIIIGLIILLEGLHEEVSSFLGFLGLWFSTTGLVFFGLIESRVCCCLGHISVLCPHAVFERC